MNLSRAVQLAVDIGSHIDDEKHLPALSTVRKVFDSLQGVGVLSKVVSIRMTNIFGFRNVTVHCYDDLNLIIGLAICTQRLDDFKQFSEMKCTAYCKQHHGIELRVK